MLTSQEQERYARQIMMPELGEAGQETLKRSRVLVIGAGGLGSPAAYYLAVPAANLLNEMFGVYQKFGENFWYVAGGIAVFVLCKLLLGIIARLLTKIANSVKAVGAANTLLGAAVGFLKAGILILAVLAVLSVLPETLSFVPKAQAAIDKTFFVHTLRDNNPLLTLLLKVIDRAKEGLGTEAAWLLP